MKLVCVATNSRRAFVAVAEWGATRRGGRATGRLERFVEGFLRLVVLVALALVELVGAEAFDFGAHGHAASAVLAGPGFGSIEKKYAGAVAAMVFVDDEAVDFSACADFEKVGNADVSPADHFFGGRFSNEQSIEPGGFHFAEHFGDFRGSGGVAELRGEIGEAGSVGGASAADS